MQFVKAPAQVQGGQAGIEVLQLAQGQAEFGVEVELEVANACAARCRPAEVAEQDVEIGQAELHQQVPKAEQVAKGQLGHGDGQRPQVGVLQRQN